MSYLEKKVEEFKTKMEDDLKSGNRDRMKQWKQRWIAASSKKASIENACAQGLLTPEDYIRALEKQ